MRNILIVLERFDCGGVETYVYTLARNLSANCKIFIASGGGEIVEDLKKLGIEHYNINFFDTTDDGIHENTNKIVKIIKENNIDCVNINPFFTYYSTIYACIYSKVPYVLTIHDAIGKPAWRYIGEEYILFMESAAFKYASSIIFVSGESKDKYVSDFSIDNKNRFVVSNGVDLETFKQNTTVDNKLRKFIIISRLDEDKKNSIINGIDLFVRYSNKCGMESCFLSIAGTGSIYTFVEDYIRKFPALNIKMLGNVTNVYSIINKYDLVIGMGRVALESMACKILVVLSGYDNLKGVIIPENVDMMSKANFSGRNMININEDDVVDEIINISTLEREEILLGNYEKVNEKFNSKYNSEKILNIFQNNNELVYTKNDYVINKINEFLQIRNIFTKLKQNLNNVNEMNSKLKQDLNNASEINSKLKQDLNNVNEINREYKEKTELLSENLEILKSELSKVQYDNNNLESKLLEQENKQKCLNSKIEALSEENSNLNRNLSNANNELNKIYHSRMWKVAVTYYKFRDRIIGFLHNRRN